MVMQDSTLRNAWLRYKNRRSDGSFCHVKVNLYRDYEVRAIAKAVGVAESVFVGDWLECLMVSDSFLMTHLGRDSTRLSSHHECNMFLGTMLRLTKECRDALDASFCSERRPYLMADMPDGMSNSEDIALSAANRFSDQGADSVKIEITTFEKLKIVEFLVSRGHHVAAHLGYTPQAGDGRRFGTNLAEALYLFEMARASRDHGAGAIILERVAQAVNQRLAAPSPNGLPIFSIFSGLCKGGAQSLNVWDSVFRPPFSAKYFPPTAKLEASSYPESYSESVITKHFYELLELSLSGRFPLKQSESWTASDLACLNATDPWN